jgi:UDP-N-acetylglucosamine 1-carboxyvinyltransferase
MGANISVDGRTAIIKGVEQLRAAKVAAMDLRGGAALVLAGLVADGETIVDNSKHIERGYESIEKRLISLGADVRYENEYQNI